MSNTVTYSSCVTFAFTYDGFGRVFRTDHYPLTTGHDSYVWGNDLSGTPQGAGGVGGLLAVIPGAQGFRPASHPCHDANGNVTEYVDGNGVTAAHYAYDAYGNTTVKSGLMADDFNFRFSAKYFDAETGNYYYINRHYSPALGRFISQDPIGIQDGPNLYAFCKNDPVNRWDYLGMILGGCSQTKATQTYKPVMAAIFLSPIQIGGETETEAMMQLLQGMDKNLIWELNLEPLPAGTKKGKQKNKTYKGTCYKEVYFVKAGLEFKQAEGYYVLGTARIGNFEATLWFNVVKNNYQLYDSGGRGERLDNRVSALGVEKAYHKIGGLLLAHEILHSVGAWHTATGDSTSIMVPVPTRKERNTGRIRGDSTSIMVPVPTFSIIPFCQLLGDSTSIMVPVPTWNWILKPPVITQQTVTAVKKELKVEP